MRNMATETKRPQTIYFRCLIGWGLPKMMFLSLKQMDDSMGLEENVYGGLQAYIHHIIKALKETTFEQILSV